MTETTLYRYHLPLVAPLRFSGGALHAREGLIVRRRGDDGEGWGEIAPLPGFSVEALDDALAAVRAFYEARVPWSSMPPSARFGCAAATRPLVTTEATLPLNALLVGDASEVLDRARDVVARGYRAAKLKVGRRPVEDDARLVREVAAVLAGRCALRLDANRAWSWDHAVRFARAVADAPIEYVEEPLADASALRRLAAETGLAVALDESLRELSFEAMARCDFARAFVIKPTLHGYEEAVRVAGVARSIGVSSVLSSCVESGLGTIALVRCATEWGVGLAPAGLDTLRWLADDVIEPRLDVDASAWNVAEVVRGDRRVQTEKLERVATFTSP